jgi:hypothetical protein
MYKKFEYIRNNKKFLHFRIKTVFLVCLSQYMGKNIENYDIFGS